MSALVGFNVTAIYHRPLSTLCLFSARPCVKCMGARRYGYIDSFNSTVFIRPISLDFWEPCNFLYQHAFRNTVPVTDALGAGAADHDSLLGGFPSPAIAYNPPVHHAKGLLGRYTHTFVFKYTAKSPRRPVALPLGAPGRWMAGRGAKYLGTGRSGAW